MTHVDRIGNIYEFLEIQGIYIDYTLPDFILKQRDVITDMKIYVMIFV